MDLDVKFDSLLLVSGTFSHLMWSDSGRRAQSFTVTKGTGVVQQFIRNR